VLNRVRVPSADLFKLTSRYINKVCGIQFQTRTHQILEIIEYMYVLTTYHSIFEIEILKILAYQDEDINIMGKINRILLIGVILNSFIIA